MDLWTDFLMKYCQGLGWENGTRPSTSQGKAVGRRMSRP